MKKMFGHNFKRNALVVMNSLVLLSNSGDFRHVNEQCTMPIYRGHFEQQPAKSISNLDSGGHSSLDNMNQE